MARVDCYQWLYAIYNNNKLLPEPWILNSLRPSDNIWQHRSGSTLAQVMASCLMAPSHYMNLCWLHQSLKLILKLCLRFHSNLPDANGLIKAQDAIAKRGQSGFLFWCFNKICFLQNVVLLRHHVSHVMMSLIRSPWWRPCPWVTSSEAMIWLSIIVFIHWFMNYFMIETSDHMINSILWINIWNFPDIQATKLPFFFNL